MCYCYIKLLNLHCTVDCVAFFSLLKSTWAMDINYKYNRNGNSTLAICIVFYCGRSHGLFYVHVNRSDSNGRLHT